MIDSFVMSERAAALVRDVWVDAQVPWWPHYGIWVRIGSRPSQVMSRQLVRRRAALPQHEEPAAEDGSAAHEGDQADPSATAHPSVDKSALWDRSWRAAAQASTVRHDAAAAPAAADDYAELDDVDGACKHYAGQMGIRREAGSLGATYTTWRHAVLIYFNVAAKENLELTENVDIPTALVDDRWFDARPTRPSTTMVVERRPVVQRSTGKEFGGVASRSRGGGGPVEVRLLRVVRQWMRSLGRWSRGANFHRNHTAHNVAALAARFLGGDSAAVASLWANLGASDSGALLSAVVPPLINVLNGQATDTAEAEAVVERLLKAAVNMGYERKRRDFDNWITSALEGGARAAHRYLSREVKPPPLELVVSRGEGATRSVISDPDTIAEHYATPWRKQWECDDAEGASDEREVVRRLREEGAEDAAAYAANLDLSPGAIRMGCRTFAASTSIGADDVPFKVVAQLPDGALVVLGQLMREALRCMALPMDALLNLLSLLGKKGGGSRTVATMASFYRLLLRVAGDDVADWDADKAGHWDTAIAGSSPLRAHLLRALEVELAVAEGLSVSHFLWDMEKFYDAIKLSKLIPRLNKLGYPMVLATMGMVAHRAPRVVCTGVAVSKPIVGAARSILAGCQQSVSWARGLLHKMVENLGYIVPGSICFEHVDDLSQVVTARTGWSLQLACVALGEAVLEEASDADVRLSAKSVLLPAGDPYVEAAALALRAKGVRIRTAKAADDLGIQCAAGRRRTTATIQKRMRTAAVKAERLHRLAKRNRTAEKLARPALGSTQSYGHQAQGVARTMMQAMRRTFRRSSHLGHVAGCTTTTIWWSFGAGADPAVRLPMEQIGEWIDIWMGSGPVLRRRIRNMWMKEMPPLVKHEQRWSCARGPMRATICTLVDMGWKPASPDHWRVSDTLMAVVGGASFAKSHILAQAYRTLVARLASEARSHHFGEGIGDDILFQGARNAKKVLVRKEEYAAAAALDFIVVGAFHDPPQPVDGSPARTEHRCQRCKTGAVATRLHDFYLCEDNAAIDEAGDEAARIAAAGIVKEALEDHARRPCLWFRGLIPADMAPPPADIPFDAARVHVTANMAALLERTRTCYSDGSGGEDGIHPKCRKVASGAAAYFREAASGTVEVGGLAAEVPGRQTVPRAEVWGATLGLELAPRVGPFNVVLDASYVYGALSRRAELLRGLNGDLWSIFFGVLDGTGVDLTLSKVRSHVMEKRRGEVRNGSHDPRHILGNELADAAAAAGVALFAPSDGAASRKARFAEDRACAVAVRLARIQARIWEKIAGVCVCVCTNRLRCLALTRKKQTRNARWRTCWRRWRATATD